MLKRHWKCENKGFLTGANLDIILHIYYIRLECLTIILGKMNKQKKEKGRKNVCFI